MAIEWLLSAWRVERLSYNLAVQLFFSCDYGQYHGFCNMIRSHSATTTDNITDFVI